MIIVDTHCHAGLTKYEPVESLLRHMETSGVDQAVLIQYMGNTDNGYLVDCLARFPGKLAAAMIVPQEDDGSAVRRWAERGIQGIRLRPDARAAAADPLAQWRAADEEELVVSAPSRPEWLLSARFAEVTDTFPDLRIVIEHLGGMGTGHFTAVIHHPEVAILGLGRAQQTPVLDEAGQWEPRLMMPITIGCDHRVIDGADGARFINWITEAIDQPFLLAL